MKKISVIVPVYNTSKYLRRCVDSLLNQTYENLEIILIDDGSTDNSGIICDEYEKKDSRVRVLHKTNGGQSTARNLALKYVSGDYIGFVDSDDWISLDMYYHLMNIVEENNADVGFIERIMVYDTPLKEKDIKVKINTYTGKDILIEYLEYGMKTGNYGLPNYLYNAKLFKNIFFPEGRICEDIVTNYKLLKKANKMVKSNKICYYYYQCNNSTTRNLFSIKDYDLLFACNQLEKLAKVENNQIKKLVFEKKIRSYFSLICKIDRYGCVNTINEKKELKKLLDLFKPHLFTFLRTKAKTNRKLMAIMIVLNNNFFKFIVRKRKI